MFLKKRVQKTVDCKSTSLFLVQSPVSYSVWIYNCNEKSNVVANGWVQNLLIN